LKSSLSTSFDALQTSMRRGPDLAASLRSSWEARVAAVCEKYLDLVDERRPTAKFKAAEARQLLDWVLHPPFCLDLGSAGLFCGFFGTPQLLEQLLFAVVGAIKVNNTRDGPALLSADVWRALKDEGLIRSGPFFDDDPGGEQAPFRTVVYQLCRGVLGVRGGGTLTLPLESVVRTTQE
jgi:hypothetical protein